MGAYYHYYYYPIISIRWDSDIQGFYILGFSQPSEKNHHHPSHPQICDRDCFIPLLRHELELQIGRLVSGKWESVQHLSPKMALCLYLIYEAS